MTVPLFFGPLAVLMLAMATALTPAQIVSPEVHPDRTVTFRLRMPSATSVKLGLEGFDAMPMAKDRMGVWSITTHPLDSDIYGYSFDVDGVSLLDPSNHVIKPSLLYNSNMVLVPGYPPEAWEVQNVPHGTVHHEFYRSSIVGDQRDYYVYTPPGYNPAGRAKYPVLYLLHGFSDNAAGWTAVGKAHVILDNLIASGKVRPMIVAMPLGYGVPDFSMMLHTKFTPESMKGIYDKVTGALFDELMPRVEQEYKTFTDSKHRAIAGLSMGGAQSLYIGLNHLDQFSFIGAFSSGGLNGNDLASNFPHLEAKNANKHLRELWISCGKDDGLLPFNRKVVAWLKDKGIHAQSFETSGRHEWPVWRRNLIAFSELLFR